MSRLTIADHENGHVAFLKQTLRGQAVAKPEFDFTAGGAIPNPFKNYELFTAPIASRHLTIHSVEARHASEVRRLRGESSRGVS